MRQSLLATVLGQMLFAASAALAQTPTPGGSPGTPPAGAPAGGGGLGNYWWIILVVVLAIAAIWYFMRGRNRV